jgi:glucose repression regulatory protein TUP1
LYRYDEEIARLRHQLEHQQGGGGAVPTTATSKPQLQPLSKDQPPNIGPGGSNYFDGIMSSNGGSTVPNAAPPPPLVAPPTLENKKQPAGYYSKIDTRVMKPASPSLQQSPPKPQALVQSPPASISLADIDPNSLPDNLKLEGLDWFTL